MHVGLTRQHALLYNTLDGETIESNKAEIIELLRKTTQKKNCGVSLLRHGEYEQKDINAFIQEMREKYMGDIIDVALSKGKPVQLLPFFNFPDPNKLDIYKKHNFSSSKDALEKLSEISIHVDHTTDVAKLIPFLQSASGRITFSLVGNIWSVENYTELLSFLNQYPFLKNIVCSYKHIMISQTALEGKFLYKIQVQFPIDRQKWDNSRQILLQQALPFEYVFEVTSAEDCEHAEQLIKQFQIEKYQLHPVYTGDNIRFFEENIFLTKEDILASSLSIKDFFTHQAMNIYDFGKLNIMPNGDVYANVNHPVLGSIHTHSIYEIACKEVEEGKSWLRIRNQAPCNNCVYQWLCPHPSNYEIVIGRPNLCHVKQ